MCAVHGGASSGLGSGSVGMEKPRKALVPCAWGEWCVVVPSLSPAQGLRSLHRAPDPGSVSGERHPLVPAIEYTFSNFY